MKKTTKIVEQIHDKTNAMDIAPSSGRVKKTNGVSNGMAKISRNFETRFEPRYDQTPEMPEGLEEPSFSESSNKILKERYLLKGGNLEVAETIQQRFWNMSYDIASGDFDFGASKKEVLDLARRFYNFMVKQQFLPNSPTIMNAGKQNQLQYSACFVLPVGDSLPEIFDSIKYAALIHQTGGGTGFAFSRLRPQGSIVKRSGGVASGPVSFLRVFNAATEAIKQGGTRRGANMGILRIDHPDILEFIRCKSELDDHNKPIYDDIAPMLSEEAQRAFRTKLLDTQIANFNISAAVTDRFMDAYSKGVDYELIDPKTKEVVGVLNAKAVMDEIVERAWQTGDPGLIFIDRINNSPANPVPELEEIESTNPCITADSWVQTSLGPRQVSELIGVSFKALVNGQVFPSSEKGFFKTGTKEVVKLQTKEGYSLKLTTNHLVKKVVKNNRYRMESEWVEAGNLRNGDKVLINNHQKIEWEGSYSFDEGYLMGLLIGDGTLKKDKAVLSVWDKSVSSGGENGVMGQAMQAISALPHRADFLGWTHIAQRGEYRLSAGYIKGLALELGMDVGKKMITNKLEKSSSSFYEGFLRGFFDADGSVQGSQLKGVSVRLSQSNLGHLETVQRMLLRLGIVSRIYKNRRVEKLTMLPDGKGGRKQYPTRSQHELVISGENLIRFNDRVGFSDRQKANKLAKLLLSYKRVLNREKFVVIVENLVNIGAEDVYDTQILGINSFDANGLIVHNCGEQPLAPWDACNLGSINLGKFVKYLDDGQPVVDWDGLRETVRLSVHFLDNVVQTNPYTLPQIYDEVHKNRRIGLGVMGWADMLFKMKTPYSSDEAIALAEKVMKFINEEGHRMSEELAATKGPFGNWAHSIYKAGKPLRNSTVTTIAPTGTISIIGDCSSGIEPVFALAYIHKAKGDGGKTGNEMRLLTIANKTFKELSEAEGFYSEELAQKVMQNGSVSGVDDVPADWQRVFITAPEISPEWHIKMQAAFQRFTDNGVSKTINLPNHSTIDDVKQAYLMAWETGCKGITVYRDGSKSVQVLNVSSSLKKAPAVPVAIDDVSVQLSDSQDTFVHRPMTLRGRTYKMITPVGEGFITINRDEQDNPFEVFVTVAKGGTHTMADAEAIGRLVSLSLRLSRNAKAVNPQIVAEKIVAQLRGIGGASHIGFGKDRVMSLADAIAKALAEDMALNAREPKSEMVPLNLVESNEGSNGISVQPLFGNTKAQADLCPECGDASFVFEEGCKKCHSCGYSMC